MAASRLGIPVVTAIFPHMVPMLFVLHRFEFFFLPIELVLLGVGNNSRPQTAGKKRAARACRGLRRCDADPG